MLLSRLLDQFQQQFLLNKIIRKLKIIRKQMFWSLTMYVPWPWHVSLSQTFRFPPFFSSLKGPCSVPPVLFFFNKVEVKHKGLFFLYWKDVFLELNCLFSWVILLLISTNPSWPNLFKNKQVLPSSLFVTFPLLSAFLKVPVGHTRLASAIEIF